MPTAWPAPRLACAASSAVPRANVHMFQKWGVPLDLCHEAKSSTDEATSTKTSCDAPQTNNKGRTGGETLESRELGSPMRQRSFCVKTIQFDFTMSARWLTDFLPESRHGFPHSMSQLLYGPILTESVHDVSSHRSDNGKQSASRCGDDGGSSTLTNQPWGKLDCADKSEGRHHWNGVAED
jgi:hypothetical protein